MTKTGRDTLKTCDTAAKHAKQQQRNNESTLTAKALVYYQRWYYWLHASNVNVVYKSAMHMTVEH